MPDTPYLDELESPEQYVEGVATVLQYWLDLHTKAEAWAWHEIIDEDPAFTYQESIRNGPMRNSYYEFDLVEAVRQRQAVTDRQLYHQCRRCGYITDVYDEHEECCNTKCKDKWKTPTVEALLQWAREYDSGFGQPENDLIILVLIEDGFPVYREALEPYTRKVEEEIAQVLSAIALASTNADRLQAAMWGTRVLHVHGNVMEDYAQHLGYGGQQIYDIRNQGLESVFTSEQVAEWLAEDNQVEVA